MKTITVEVQEDHLQTLSRVKKPILAISELIWNGLDANANNVKVALNRNALGSIDSINVIDDGHGIKDVEAAQQAIIKIAKRLEQEGKIQLMGGGGEDEFV